MVEVFFFEVAVDRLLFVFKDAKLSFNAALVRDVLFAI
tara:strand:- start:2571 stop:2684 length:114 start_codon:yes stop_codon:yes gene_type:complete